MHPSTDPYSSLVIVVLKEEGNWCMCMEFYALNKLMIKDKFPTLVMDDLLDEIHGIQFFTNLDLNFEYRQIKMKELRITKATL